jgi:hypothetical protein
MVSKSGDYVRRATKPDIIAAIIIAVTVIAVTVNTTTVIMQNYQLEREIRVMEQKVAVAQIELETQRAKNLYYGTEYYLDIAARKQLSIGSPGEKLIIVPKSVALAQLPAGYEQTATQETESSQENLPNYRKWQLFLTGNLR